MGACSLISSMKITRQNDKGIRNFGRISEAVESEKGDDQGNGFRLYSH